VAASHPLQQLRQWPKQQVLAPGGHVDTHPPFWHVSQFASHPTHFPICMYWHLDASQGRQTPSSWQNSPAGQSDWQ
jgi:hypothetical protein